MYLSYKLALNILLLCTIVAVVYLVQYDHIFSSKTESSNLDISPTMTETYNLWCIFTKANSSYRLRQNLRKFVKNLLLNSTITLNLHVVSDNASAVIADEILSESAKNKLIWEFHDVVDLTQSMQEIIVTMQRHFSSQPGAYYGDALFFLSLGLHRVTSQSRAIMMDVDTELRTDIRELFDEFDRMPETALIGAAPEQTPVYRHVLHMYRAENRHTKFGEPLSSRGNPGLNSGVLLLNFEGQRKSKLFQLLLTAPQVASLCDKYKFHGHLGDQDWYTLISEEYPELIHWLDCTWNRQLCLWWRHHGYHDIFDLFHHCRGPINIYHGNCNTPVPYRAK